MSDFSSILPSGTSLQGGKYRIIRVLGQGGFGITYLAEQTGLGMKVAIKEFFLKGSCQRDTTTSQVSVPVTDNQELVAKCLKKFKSEARKIASLNNDHIVSIIDIFDENGTSYYVMKYLDGGSLADRIKNGPIPEKDALDIIKEVADALDAVHSNGLLHLDVKPANILFDNQGRSVLIDFGVSKYFDSQDNTATTSSLIGFSRGYAPLEQVNAMASSLSPATDIYSLGATLYSLVVGIAPPDASTVMETGLPTMPMGISSSTRRAIEAAMQPRRNARPQNIYSFLSLLEIDPIVSLINEDDDKTVVKRSIDTVDSKESTPSKVLSETSSTNRPFSPRRKWFYAILIILAPLLLIVLYKSIKPDITTDKGSYIERIDSLLIGGTVNDSTTIVSSSNQRKIEYKKNFPERIVYSLSSEDDWCSLEIVEDSVLISCLENKSHEGRQISVRFMKEADSTVLASLTVFQEGAERTIPQWIEDSVSGVERGHEYVDLGLSVLWATCNVGAKVLSDYGGYYAYGETKTKKKEEYDSEHYKYIDPEHIDYPHKYIRYDSSNGHPETMLYPEDDAAHVLWGGKWRIPSKAEQQELIDKCKHVWTSVNGHYGFKFTGPSGKSIFLPAAGIMNTVSVARIDDLGWRGFYHARDAHSNDKYGVKMNSFMFENLYGTIDMGVYTTYPFYEYGRTIRPVMNK